MNTHPEHDDEGLELPAHHHGARQTKLARLSRKLGLGAFGVSLLVHALFILCAAFLFYKWVAPVAEEPEIPSPKGGGGSSGEMVKLQQQSRKMMTASSSLAPRIITNNPSTFSLPDASPELLESGLPMAISTGSDGDNGSIGRGRGPGEGNLSGPGPKDGVGKFNFNFVPTPLRNRCNPTERLSMIRSAGGNAKVDEAVVRSLDWLKKQQNSDGSWGAQHQVAMTGLALLCYLGHCETTQSEAYRDNVLKAITYLVNVSKKNNGRMASQFAQHGWVYEHAIATYAIAEAYTFSKNLQFPIPDLKESVELAAAIIISGQTARGGWDYGYVASSARNDLSVAGWQMQALKAVKVSGLKVNGFDNCIEKALAWLGKEAHKGDGRFSYTDGAAPAMTAVGTLCLQQWGKGKSSPAHDGIKLIMDGLQSRDEAKPRIKDPFSALYDLKYDGGNADLYAWYYAVQVMRNEGGKEWELTNKAILADILTAQNDDGSFKSENASNEIVRIKSSSAGTSRSIYVHCLNTLMLEVYFRFLPATSAGSSHSPGFDDLK